MKAATVGSAAAEVARKPPATKQRDSERRRQRGDVSNEQQGKAEALALRLVERKVSVEAMLEGESLTDVELNSLLLAVRGLPEAAELTFRIMDWAVDAMPAPAPNVFCCTTAMSTLGRARRPDEAKKIFAAMRERGVEANTHAYTALVSSLGRAGRWLEALQAKDDMRQEGFRPTQHTYSAVIAACARSGKVDHALQALEEMRSIGLQPNEHTGSAIIAACARAGLVDKAREVFESLNRANEHAVASLASACARAGDTRGAERLLLLAREGRVPFDTCVCNALADAFARKGLDGLTEEACSLAPEADVITHNCLIRAKANAGRPSDAVEAFNAMAREGIKGNGTTASLAMSAALKLREPSEAERVLAVAQSRWGIDLDGVVLGLLVSARALSGDSEGALAAYRSAPPSCRPDGRAVSTMCKSLLQSKELDGAWEIFSSSCGRPDRSTHKAFVTASLAERRPGDALFALRAMVDEGYRPEPRLVREVLRRATLFREPDVAASALSLMSRLGLEAGPKVMRLINAYLSVPGAKSEED